MKTVDRMALDSLKLMNDDYVKEELNETPLSIDEKISVLRDALEKVKREYTNSKVWKTPALEKETIQTIKEELEYWEAQKDDTAPKRSGGNYGTHQDNREWIITTFQDQPEHLSQNKTAEAVQELYKKEFGYSVDKSTILGMAVYKNR